MKASTESARERSIISAAPSKRPSARLSPLIIGMDPFQVEMISQKLIRDVYSEGAQIHMCAVSAIEIALWDIIGKATNQPIYNLWGGRCHEKLRAYANGWYRGPRTPESFAEKAKIVAGRGYTALKFDPFGDAWRMLPRAEFDLSLDIITAVREAVGTKVDLLIEGHCRFNVATAVEFSMAMHHLRPTWFEEPVAHTNIMADGESQRLPQPRTYPRLAKASPASSSSPTCCSTTPSASFNPSL